VSVEDIRTELDAATARWRLVAEREPVDTLNGCVMFVRRGAERLVLKIVGAASDEMQALPAYAHFAERGAVRLLAQAGRALLLERIDPGHALTQRVIDGDDDGATAILCDVMASLHRAAPPPAGLARVEDFSADFDRYRASGGPLPAALVDRAAAVFSDLCHSQGPRVVLHGDLHHDNVLDAGGGRWVAIDPKGVIGEPAYETGALLRNPRPELLAADDPAGVLRRRSAQLAEALDLDLARVREWAYVQAELSAAWHVEDGEDPAFALAVAELLEPLTRGR